MKTFWFLSASSFSIFFGTKAHFWQRENIIRFFHSSLFATKITLALVDAGMENADQSGLFECICNTFSKRVTFELLTEFSKKCFELFYIKCCQVPNKNIHIKNPFLTMHQANYTIIFSEFCHWSIHVHHLPKQLYNLWSLSYKLPSNYRYYLIPYSIF